MGIYDRDYIREKEPPRMGGGTFGMAAMRMWSITTWLIIINCAFFVTDHFLIPRDAWRPVEIGLLIEEGATASPVYVRHPQEDAILASPNPQYPFLRPVLDPQTGDQIGQSTWQWMPPLKRWLHFSTASGFLSVQFWRLIGFQFLHYDLSHLFFNMLGLFFFGPMVEEYLGRKRYLAFYLLAGICGALLYVVLNLTGITVSLLASQDVTIPGLLFNDPRVPLVGASAGVFGVLMAGAYLAPNATVLLFFILPMRLKTVAYGLVLVAFFTVIFGGNNAGGEAGHLGGALAGFYFIRRPHHLHGFFDIIGRVDPTSHHYRGRRERRDELQLDAEIDRILIKIKEQGMDSLTPRERSILRQSSKRE